MFIISPCEAAQGRNLRHPVQIKAAEADGARMHQQLYHEPTAPSPKHGNEEQSMCVLYEGRPARRSSAFHVK